MAGLKGHEKVLKLKVRVQHTDTGAWLDVPAYKMLDTHQMAIVSHLSERWFQDRRRDGTGPRWYRCGDQVIRYLWPDWVAWLEKQERSPYMTVLDDAEI